MARGVRDETGRERDDGDHGHDPRRREGALKPEKKKKRNINVRQENERRKAKILKENRNLNMKSQENKRTKQNVRDRQKQNNDTGLANRVTFKMSWRAREVDFNDVEANFRSRDMPVQVSVRFWAERLRVKER